MTGINESEIQNSVSIYPNPASENFTITFDANEESNYTIAIYDALGNQVELIYSGSISNGLTNFEYNASNLAAGIYVIRIESEAQINSVKLIKQ